MPNYIDLIRSHIKGDGKTTEEPETGKDLRSTAARAEYPVGELVDESMDVQKSATSNDLEPPLSLAEATPQDRHWLKQCIHYVSAVFRSAEQHKVNSITPLSNHIRELISSLPDHPDQLAAMELMVSERSKKIRELFGDLVEKSMIMMLYAIKSGLQLRLNDDELHALVLAGMLHHIGMTQIPTAIRQKKEKLTKKEQDLINLAPQQGKEYLRQCSISDERILSAILQSRERFDGSGQAGMKGNEISRTARVIGLLSMFEALIHYRPYRKRMLPRNAIREILIHHKSAFDPTFLKCLIDAISLYPVGTYVQLNSGDIGKVVRVHRRLPLRPIVHVTMDRHGNGIIPRDINLQHQPNLIVERCMYAEDLKNL